MRVQVYVDTVGDPDKYQAKLAARFPTVRKVVVSKKADSLFPIVSAASICAKVTRDDLLRRWEFEEANLDVSREFGSGYPGGASATARVRRALWRPNDVLPRQHLARASTSQTRPRCNGCSATSTRCLASRPSFGSAGAPPTA